MNSASQFRPSYTVKDYQCWEGDWELWHGSAVAMSPSPFGIHAALLAQVARLFGNAVEAANCDSTVLAEIDWIVSEDTVVRPDLTIVCGKPPARHVEAPPAVIVEILSESTKERDLVHKKNLFQANSVAWYLIVDPENETTTVLQLNQVGEYIQLPAETGLAISICDRCELQLDLSRLF